MLRFGEETYALGFTKVYASSHATACYILAGAWLPQSKAVPPNVPCAWRSFAAHSDGTLDAGE